MEIIPTSCASTESPVDRRRMFAKSKSVKTCYSMPVPVRRSLLHLDLLH